MSNAWKFGILGAVGIVGALGLAACAAKRYDDPPTDDGRGPHRLDPDATFGAPLTDGARTLVERLSRPLDAPIQAWGVRDDTGTSLDTLKIIDRPGGGYFGISHIDTGGGVFDVRLASSDDLVTWKHERMSTATPTPRSSRRASTATSAIGTRSRSAARSCR